MPNFRRAVIRLLLVTCFLLLVAWVSLKVMQYNGDWERLLHDLSRNTEGVQRFFKKEILPRLEVAGNFVNEKVGPVVEDLFEKAKDLVQK